MSIQKKVLPLLGFLIVMHDTTYANWWDTAKSTATEAWNDNKGTITTAAQNAWQQNQGKVSAAAKAGEGVITDGGNFREAVDKAETTFDTTKSAQTPDPRGLQQQAQAKLTVFSQLPHVTDEQKAALHSLYQQQQYQPVITVIEKTDDVFAMLARTPEETKKANEDTLTQMSQAFSAVTAENIAETTKNIHTFIKGIAPEEKFNSMSDEEFDKEVLEAVEKKYGALFQQMAAMEQSRAQPPQQPVHNMFMSSANG